MAPTQPRPILKLKVGSKGAAIGPSNSNGNVPSPSPVVQTPTSTTTPRLKIKFGGGTKVKPESEEPTPSPAQPSPKIKFTTKKKPQLIKLNTKKRDHDEVEGDVPDSAISTTSTGIKKIKLTQKAKTPLTPYLKLKPKGKPPPRPKGLAYDSEASDREDDPAIEEEFILRMIPGDDCEYIRKAIEEKRWGPRSQGGADIRLKFLQADGRRAVLAVRGKIYAAALVDMPCIVEGMKSWDKKSWYKAADICQMVLVLGLVNSEAEAATYPLPQAEVDKESYTYAHGITPPMRWVRKRRFRPRVSVRTIEAVEEEVNRLLRMDAESDNRVSYELVDLDRLSRGPSGRGDSEQPEEEDGYEDAEGEEEADFEQEGYFDDAEMEEDMEADLAAAFMAGGDEEEEEMEVATPAESSSAIQDMNNVTDSEATTPAPGATSKEDSGDDDSDDDEIDDMDEDAMEQKAEMNRAREEISDLEAVIREQVAEAGAIANNILRRRKLDKINALKQDLERKKLAIGEGGDD